MRSISKLSRRTPLEVPRNIPSITTPIDGSKLLSLSSDATPLIVIAAPLAIPGVRLMNRFGAKAWMSSKRRTLPSLSCPVIAVTAPGTSWIDSSFFRAVTMTSSSTNDRSLAYTGAPLNSAKLADTIPTTLTRPIARAFNPLIFRK